ncbi:MAG: hypothetical protein FJ095_12350 [Deltaproteobacteria bacterium]|nr:hypothetical protein [Deltaproteobacteria bacterium]
MSTREPEQARTLLLASTELGRAAARAVGAPSARAPLGTDVLPEDAVELVSFRSLELLHQTAPFPAEEQPGDDLSRTRF